MMESKGAIDMPGATDAATRIGTLDTRIDHGEFEEPRIARWFFSRSESAWIWLLIRLYVGYQWLLAGWEKLHSPAWTGAQAGTALNAFVAGALKQVGGAHPNVQGWYGDFLRAVVLPHAAAFGYMVAFGETIVGLALILGLLTGIAAFFGSFMNVNYLLAGAVSTNPVLFVLATFLVLAWRVSGWWGVDRWLLPTLGTPWHPGRAWHSR